MKFHGPRQVLPAPSMIYSRSIFSGNLSDAKEKHTYIYIHMILYRLFHYIILYSYINIILCVCILIKEEKGDCVCVHAPVHICE